MNLTLRRYRKFICLLILATTISIWPANLHSVDFRSPELQVPTWTYLSSTSSDVPSPAANKEQTASLVLDVDMDGLNDIIIAGRGDPGPSIVLLRRNNSGWDRYILESSILPIEAGGAYHDIDQDGDPDIVFGGDNGSMALWWWENPYPNFAPDEGWTRREIKSTGGRKHHDQIFGDFDDDGQTELVFWNQTARSLLMAEIPDDPYQSEPWALTKIYSYEGVEHEGLTQADIDGDGVNDIVGGGRWFKLDASGNFVAHLIDDDQRFSRTASGQLKAGGRPEVVFGIGDGVGSLKWYEWKDDRWQGHDLLDVSVDHGHSLDVVDVNQDGDLDIFSAEMRLGGSNPQAKMRLFLGDGTGNFELTEVATGYGNHESKISDLDGDGDLDILGKPYKWQTPRIDIWLNEQSTEPIQSLEQSPLPSAAHWCRRVVDENRPWRAIFVTTADMDGDKDNDIVTGGWWYENGGETDAPWQRHPIGEPLNNLAVVHDFDGDGDADVLGTTGRGAQQSSTFVWAQNNGSGEFEIFENIQQASGDFLQGATAGQFRQNGPLEIMLSWHQKGQGIQALTVPEDPTIDVWAWRKVSSISQDEELSADDIDGDGDLDLLLGTKWLRNDQDAWTELLVAESNEAPDRNRLADIDQDGDLDAVVGFEALNTEGKLTWYEQPTSTNAVTWIEHEIASLIGPMSVDVRDMDQDGDLDVIVGEHNLAEPNAAGLYIYQNEDGNGRAWVEQVVYKGDEHHDGSHVTDIDNDGDLDIVSIGWGHRRVVLYENSVEACDAIRPSNQALKQPQAEVSAERQTAQPTRQVGSPKDANATPVVSATPDATSTPVAKSEYKPSPIQSCTVDGLQALYTFQEGSGSVIRDVSQRGEPLNLQIDSSSHTWLKGGGIVLSAPALMSSEQSATKVIEASQATNELTVEVWLEPENLSQDGPARIVTLSAGPTFRNFTLGQGKFGNHPTDVFDARLRTSGNQTNDNGQPSLTSASGSVQLAKHHVVYTRQADGQSSLYIDGKEVESTVHDGGFSNWDPSHRLGLANELTGDRPWLGTLYRVAIYNCAFSSFEASIKYVKGLRSLDVSQ